ncbi:MAG: phage holin family protein, partial [Oscillospiraceae bacterium]|nr:phage holin family protein [Oscillospiraceae bacterium]
LLFVIIANRLDVLIGTDYIRTGVIISFCASELISICENAGLMGVPLPSVITKAIDILKNKEGNDHDDN